MGNVEPVVETWHGLSTGARLGAPSRWGVICSVPDYPTVAQLRSGGESKRNNGVRSSPALPEGSAAHPKCCL
jgi:hypothetical protein